MGNKLNPKKIKNTHSRNFFINLRPKYKNDKTTDQKILVNIYRVLERCPPDSNQIALNFNNIPLGNRNFFRIVDVLTKIDYVTKLSVRNTGITPSSIEKFSKLLTSSHSLKEIDLSENKIGSSGTQILCESIIEQPIITGLFLNSCEIKNDCSEMLVKLMNNCPSLENLEIRRNRINNEGMKVIVSELANNYSLCNFRFDENDSISKSIKRKGIEYIERNSSVNEVLSQVVANVVSKRFHFKMTDFSKSIRGIKELKEKKEESLQSTNKELQKLFQETNKRAYRDNINDSKVEKSIWRVGFAEMMGRRETQEDVLAIKENWLKDISVDSFWADNNGFWTREELVDKISGTKYADYDEEDEENEIEVINKNELRNFPIENADFYGLFDGHGGREASEHVANNLPGRIKEKIMNGEKIETAIRDAFIEIHQEMVSWSLYTGTTAVIIIIMGNFVWVVNLGDSKAVLCRNGNTIPITKSQKPSDPEEKKRIEEAGGTVKDGRVDGILAVSRALGDGYLKNKISPVPQINSFQLSSTDSFIILACDGVWDVLSDPVAVEIVSEEIDPQKAAKRLRDEAYNHGSTDNISVITIFLQ
ncbi:phosphatase 2c [Anaeramoeba flamelloides]|uniref:Phosphatase 2c n=1 Tax=Anaeramoeba flamelloides TaxID=1746091 RepID=A0ABQ8Y3G0_9EUKA|nr:phosphatase 2c [Anaeramoeba flamelloides]